MDPKKPPTLFADTSLALPVVMATGVAAGGGGTVNGARTIGLRLHVWNLDSAKGLADRAGFESP